MSTLKVTNIQATGETASRAVSGVAAAWCNFNGTGTVAVRDSTNVASVTDSGLGNFRVNYTSDMANSDYSATFGGKWSTSVRTWYNAGNTSHPNPSTSSVTFAAYSDGTSAFVDAEYHFITIHGDLA